MVNNISQVTQTLDAFLAGDATLPQAYLFIGSSGVKTVAEDFAAKILGAKLPHVDSMQFDAAGENSNIAAIREVLQIASLMPVRSSRKVVLMENMDAASVQIMNALLKTLEEPPKHAVFILLSSRPLLPTIMSRCQVFSLTGAEHLAELPEDLSEALNLLKDSQSKGTAERMALVSKLADLEDNILSQAIELWMQEQVKRLNDQPENFAAVRNTVETLQALKGNFNKKMVLQNFVQTGLK